MNKLTLAIVLILSSSILTFAQTTDSTQQRHAIVGQWKLVQYKDYVNKRDANEPRNVSGTVVLKFEDDGYQGHVEGHTLKNQINGQYYIEKNNGIHFPSTGGMMVDEKPGWGSNLMWVLLQATSFAFEKDKLLIKYDNDSKAMVFVKTHEEETPPKYIYK